MRDEPDPPLPRVPSQLIQVRWRDLDALGHVNHATYLTFLGESRDAWLDRNIGVRAEDYVVAAVAIQYRDQIKLPDSPLTIEIRVESIGKSSLTTSERIIAANCLKAEANVTIVFWDGRHHRARRISDDERAVLDSLSPRCT